MSRMGEFAADLETARDLQGRAAAPSGDTYRGWAISWDYGRFTATGPNYEASWEGEEDGWVASGGHVEARTREGLIEEIDTWIDENGEAA